MRVVIDQNEAVASPGSDEATVGKWRQRFVGRRMDSLRDEPRASALCTIDDVSTETVILKTLKSVSANTPIGVRPAWRRPADIGLKRSAYLACS